LNSGEEQSVEAIWPVNTFRAGGYYSLDLFGGQLKVIGLNTIICASLILEDYSVQVSPDITLNSQSKGWKHLRR
jgi:hypothetical protein